LTRGASYAGFTIDHWLKSGRSGTVYLAEHPHYDRPVALKILRPEMAADWRSRARFRRDIERVARFDHPNITRVLDHGRSAGRLWVATEYVEGPDAGKLLDVGYRSGMPRTAVLMIADRVAAALDFAHGQGVVHGHVSPANILVDEPFSDQFRILLTDFGTAGSADADGVGTDQQGLAATTLELLTGQPTANGTQARARLASHPELADLQGVFDRALADDPAAGFRSCRDLVDALIDPTRTEQGHAPDRDLDTARRTSGASSRRRILPVAAALAVIVVLTSVGVHLGRTGPTGPHQMAAPPAEQLTTSTPSPCDPVTVANTLPVRDKLAQLLMVGVTDATDARAVVSEHHVGGIFIASWTDMSMLTDQSLHSITSSSGPLPLAVSVDEEGGRVQRLADLLGYQPAPRVLAYNSSPDQVRSIALDRGRRMKELGITIDFAPVVDVTDAPDNTVIGDRSFGSDAQTVSTFAGAYADGLRAAGLLPVIKHFPGHGQASGDSHLGGVTTPPLHVLQTGDLVPYRTLASETPVAIMVGHMQVPDLTGNEPASLSSAAYDLLRLGGYGGPPFQGLVFTDDLSSMGAINQRYGIDEAVLRALQAGADVALWISTDQVGAVLDRLERAVQTEELRIARVNEALARVAVAKGPNPNCGR
jgi:beta-glucosidase-like glycosyl hydrolase